MAYGISPIMSNLKDPSLFTNLPISGENKTTPKEGKVTSNPGLKSKCKFFAISGKAGAITEPTMMVKLLLSNNVIIVNFDT